jgi:hypothetical protein
VWSFTSSPLDVFTGWHLNKEKILQVWETSHKSMWTQNQQDRTWTNNIFLECSIMPTTNQTHSRKKYENYVQHVK